MSVVILRFKDGDDPNGAVLGTLTDAEISGFKLRVALRGIGMASFSISRTHPSATSALIAKGNYVTVTIPSIDVDPVWGFWLWEGQFNLLDANGDDTLTFSGPGPLGILRDAMLRYEIYAPGQTARGSSSGVDGMWFWRNEPYGAILTRIIEEGQNEPGTPLSPVTIDFDRDNDSASVTWPNIDIEYQQPIQSNVLKVFEDLRDAGDMFVASTPAFLVQAYSTFGTDRTSATFAAGKVRLQESNILTGLPVHIHATNELTHVHIRDKDGVYSTEVTPGFAGRARYGALDVPETNDPATLAKIGQETLANSTLNTNAFELEVTPGDSETTGRYLPWLHYNVGDTVTVDAETGLFAYVDEDARIVAFRVELDEASDDSTTDTAHRSLHTVMEFNAATSDGAPIEEGRAVFGAAGPGCQCLTLCRDEGGPSWQQVQTATPPFLTWDGSILTATPQVGPTGGVTRWVDVSPGGEALPIERLWRVLMHWDENVDNWSVILQMDGQPDPDSSTDWAYLTFGVIGGFYNATLETSEGGSATHNFGAAAGDDQEHEVFARVRLESGAFRARIWDVGDVEPGPWTLEDAVTSEAALDGVLESLGTKVLGVADNGGGDTNYFEVELIEPSLAGTTCIHGGPAATSGLTSAYTDQFNRDDGPPGTSDSGHTWVHQSGASAAIESRRLMVPATSVEELDVESLSLPLSATFEFNYTGALGANPLLMLDNVVVAILPATDEITVVYTDGSSGSDTASYVLDPGIRYKFHLALAANHVQVRVWPLASPEPSTWLLDLTDVAGAIAHTTKFSVGGGGSGDGYFIDNLVISGVGDSSCDHQAATCRHEHDYVAAGGTTGQALIKASDADWDTAWGTGGVTDHGALSGLADDDHPQYATNTEFDNHDARHANGGADELAVESLPTAETDTALVLHPDGTGGIEWGTDEGGGSGIAGELVTDTIVGDGVEDTFALSEAPTGSWALVSTNGADLLPTEFSIVGSDVVFDTPPANLSESLVTFITGGFVGGAAVDPLDIADPTMATAQEVAEKLNELMANMRTAGILV